MQRLGYVPALDGVRGIAIAAVVLYHFYGLPGGYMGVDLFFVLSGFLITTLLLEDGRLGRFYQRRARRLLPALGALLAACIHLGWPRLAEGGLYVANFVRAFVRPDPLGGTAVDHLWSLAEEEQFYLVWPFILGFLISRRRGLMSALAGTFLVLVAWRIGLAAAHASPRRIYFGPDTHADGLVLGCLAAIVRPTINATVGRLALVVVAAFFVVAAWTTSWFAYGLPIFEIAAILLILAAADRRLPELEFRPLVWLGLISYSLYLWHQPVHIFDHGHRLIGVAGAFVLAIASYELVEKPFRQRRARDPLAAPQPADA